MIQTIKGKLVDGDDVPIANVVVEVQFSYGESQVTGPGVPTKTDDDGSFAVEVSNNAAGVDTVALTVFDQIVHTFEFDPTEITVELGTVTVESSLDSRPRLLPVPDGSMRHYVDGVKASAEIVFAANFTNNQTKDFNGVTCTAKTSPGDFPEFEIGADLSESLDNLVAGLSASADALLTVATYRKNPAADGVVVTSVNIGRATATTYDLTGGTVTFTAPDALEGGSPGKLGLPTAQVILETDNFTVRQNDMVVSGSDDELLNATFELVSFASGHPAFIAHPTSCKIWWDNGDSRWNIGTNPTTASFYSTEAVESPELVTMWKKAGLDTDFPALAVTPSPVLRSVTKDQLYSVIFKFGSYTITAGEADSGGTGFRQLLVTNEV